MKPFKNYRTRSGEHIQNLLIYFANDSQSVNR